ncbi:hypothetical protein SAMN05216321_101138 [Cupriavidus sp. OV038]|jgi:hypothetical protein|uniref:hypothetical protein n=1 Tax=unclassified Cupriavidus TaxID=2640874 RepID=UPI0008E35A0E|nr:MULTISPECIES: hypothetical protein [unclassified Cupriavidus]SFB68868.1 hypothetical protein SAMN05216321_101138 [Cupriavidus sp. OV038]SFO58254.1 hypothetical protein SAMN05216322_101138 [Cupriavidus sp. OV096]
MSALDTSATYGTFAEKAFLDEMARKRTGAALLSGYLAAAEKRTVWDAINKAEVLLYAQLLLNAGGAGETTCQSAAGPA